MARLIWSASGERYYETGVDRGVLYVDAQPGVAWTGLTSVSEAPAGGEARPYYIDGIKYLNLSLIEEFAATINAFSSPPEFGPCDGSVAIQNGLFAAHQPRKPFGFSYRTKIGNDIDGVDHGYKIHLVYNALAAPSGRSNTSIGETTEPNEFSWSVTTVPPVVTGFRPTAHLVVDSRYTPTGLLVAIEDILYGSDAAAPRLPTVLELKTMFTSQGPVKRTNLALDPAATTNLISADELRWAPATYGTAPAAGTTTLETGTGPFAQVPTFMRKTWTVSQSTPQANVGFVHGDDTNGFPVTPGQIFVISSYLRTSASGKKGFIRFRYFDSGGVILAEVSDGSEVDLTPNQWVRVSHSHQVPAGAAWLAPWSSTALPAAAWTAGDSLDGTALLVESGDYLDTYFDGSFVDEAGMFYSWEGAANNSKSLLNTWNWA